MRTFFIWGAGARAAAAPAATIPATARIDQGTPSVPATIAVRAPSAATSRDALCQSPITKAYYISRRLPARPFARLIEIANVPCKLAVLRGFPGATMEATRANDLEMGRTTLNSRRGVRPPRGLIRTGSEITWVLRVKRLAGARLPGSPPSSIAGYPRFESLWLHRSISGMPELHRILRRLTNVAAVRAEESPCAQPGA